MIREEVLARFCRKFSLSATDAGALLGRMRAVRFRRGSFLVRQGECNRSLYIVASGIWRGSYVNAEGTDVSLWFASAGEAIFSIWGYTRGQKSLVTIEAMSDSELYVIPRAELEAYFRSSIEAANFGRVLFERQFLDLETWMISSGAPRARERYLRLMEDNPELLLHVPLQYIASYLWITPQSLSRIRAEIAREKDRPRTTEP